MSQSALASAAKCMQNFKLKCWWNMREGNECNLHSKFCLNLEHDTHVGYMYHMGIILGK